MPASASPDPYVVIAEYLVELRKAQGVTQVELARRLGQPQQFVSRVETRERMIDLIEFRDFATALGRDPLVAVGELFHLLNQKT